MERYALQDSQRTSSHLRFARTLEASMLIEFREVHDGEASTPIHVDPADVVIIREYRASRFGTPNTQIEMQSGSKYILAHEPAWVSRQINLVLKIEEVD